MPRVPKTSPITGDPTSSSFIHTLDCNFVDNAGRTLLLRGVNLSGSSKAPVDHPSYILEDFWEAAENGGSSFIGRPLNIDDGSADVHLARLRGWGFNMLRFPVTWEALEHEGPGIYDYDFMDYTVRVLRKCKQYGFKIYMDPHQDVWSRFTGGSGAPFWTLTACGFDHRNISATQAAIVHCEYPTPESPEPASLPAMIWSTNYGRLFSQTIFTLFFAGKHFAPKCIIDGKNIQDYLQEHYIEAMGKMADRIRDAGDLLESCVIGWDSMNEPYEGLCGWEDLNVNPNKQGSTLAKGSHPTPAQSMRLGMGEAQTVENWTFGMFGPSRSGSVTIDPQGKKVWADPSIEGPDGVHPKWGWRRDQGWKLGTCIWAEHGVWDVRTGEILRPNYFRLPPDYSSHPELHIVIEQSGIVPEVEFVALYWRPHWEAFSERIRRSHPEAIMFIQPPVFSPPPPISPEALKGRAVSAPHYYDGLTLITRHWNWFNADALAIKIGEPAIRKSIQEQLGIIKSDAEILGPYPTLIGEIGTPFDMDSKRSYGWTDNGRYQGDYSRQERALDASLNAADGPNAINYTIWTYCPDSCHDWGDGWNMEDLSLWSEDDVGITGRSVYMNGNGNGKSVSSSSQRTLYGIGVGSSQAMLLKKPPPSSESSYKMTSTLGGQSSSSLATMKTAGGRAELMMRWRENQYDFLTDGARAVKAFARPWPTKLVGRAVDIQFDISKTYFKLVVNVREDDKLDVDGVDEEDPASEIYVPLVHYAHERLLADRPLTPSPGSTRDLMQAGPDDLTEGNCEGDEWSSKATSQFTSRVPSSLNLNVDIPPQVQPDPASAISEVNSPSPTPTIAIPSIDWLGMASDKNLVDVDVEVSDGRWEVQGQTLKWWYDVPHPGEGDRQYTIEIRRIGGPIKMKEVEEESWVEKLCPPDGCNIM
ncbi:hypothetical protein D9758_012971 [Tetrapyrgos nigripes]|uniref:Glycoside hydrolase family 5 domain-containing protein n=1 Tax=Tetrapyrgos nigripes TaxID=182062 RepID=A0A8H5CMY4_9AGAR|nr:hypothetical protein D9758_012971 [Tetrapyrgos nigripes]